MPSIGQTLAQARRETGITIDEAAHATRIHPNMIRYIEADDYSLFASVAYAKGFILAYASFLKVDASGALEELNPKLAIDFQDDEWVDDLKGTMRRHGGFRMRLRHALRAYRHRMARRGGAPVLLNLILVTLIAALLVFYFLGFKAEDANEARAEIVKGLRSANPFASEREAEVEAETEEAPAFPLPVPEAEARRR